MDCANGAAYELAPMVFKELGAEVITIHHKPNGLNINLNCGSTHPEQLKEAVVQHQADFGLSYDGDADRLIAIDDKGEEVDGDFILAICGQAMDRDGRLKQRTIVSTVMSNIGFYKAVEAMGMQTTQTAVGDRYVMEEMRRGGYNLGGEQSGHVIFLDYSTTGDGILTSLQLADTIASSGKPLSELRKLMVKYPQVLVNVKVSDKSKYEGNERIAAAIKSVESKLGSDGRVLVRPSGTESLIRVMAEGPDKAIIEQHVQEIADVIRQELK